jgi:DNA-binding transcriptional MerR regulator
MNADRLSIGELGEAAGLSRRAVRFYVQQGLLPPPVGAGRGAHYQPEHLERLHRIGELQAAGHSLHAIRRILAGGPVPQPPARPEPRAVVGVAAQLWTRLRLGPGVELHFDPTEYNPDVSQLLQVKEAILKILRPDERGT